MKVLLLYYTIHTFCLERKERKEKKKKERIGGGGGYPYLNN